MGIQGLSAAASLVLLNGPRKQAARAMTLTIMELAASGRLTIARRPTGRGRLSINDREATVAWVPKGASTPDDATLLSVFDAANEVSSEADAATIMEIAQRTKWVRGNPARSTIDAWLYRLPLNDLYDRDLMCTRSRFMRRDVAELTPEGRRFREQLQQRLAAIEALGDKDNDPVDSLLGGAAFNAVRQDWPDADVFTRRVGLLGGVGAAADGG